YLAGATPDSYDKQFVRDWLTRSGWDKESEPPELPNDIVAQTPERYLTAYQRLVGKPLFPPKARNE
ncbi:MAG: phosphoribosylaminoimidazolesuccinocarboxamide synthase, partial [Chloroflexi bacterium]